jgi:pilus assembly protein CpaE
LIIDDGVTLMLDGRSVHAEKQSRIVLFSADADFGQTARSAFDAKIFPGFAVVETGLNGPSAEQAIDDAALLIVDLGTHESKELELSDLQHLMGRIGSNPPVIAVVAALNEAVTRKLVQMRVADILVKPVAPIELLRACTRVVRTKNEETQIYTFLPVAGGVGTTTVAIQSALTLLGSKTRKDSSTCLVDLNFYHGACADYLDIEARLNLKEIELNPERLDRQLLEGMLSRHASGLAVIAGPNLPTELASVAPNIVMGLLNVTSQCFDQIVIDMPKTWQLWTENVVLGSNKLFLVGEATVPGLRKAKQLVQVISDQLGHRARPSVIVNRFERRLFSPGLRRPDLAKTLGDAFAGTIPYNHKLVGEAIDRGAPLDEIRKGSDVAVAIKHLIVPRRAAKSNALLRSLGQLPRLHWATRRHA